ncbi:MAG TPA: toast rack family protein [Longimicrobiaceae bacterium]|nr:toast rack family protein [Longimicrobiaceae bacterium]
MFESPTRRTALAIAVTLVVGAGTAGCAEAQRWQTISASRQQQGGEKALDVEVEYGAGRLTVAPADRPLLYQFRLRYDESQVTPLAEYDRQTGALRLGVESRDGKRGIRAGRVREESRADVHLTRDVPLDLNLKFGAGEADIDLGGLSLRRLHLATGATETRVAFRTPNRVPAEDVRLEAGAASFEVVGLGNARAQRFEFQGGVGETVLDFSGAWDRNASASVKMGIGSLTLRFPRDLGVRIVKDSFLTSFDGSGMVRRGGAYYSRNWASARNRLTIQVSAALGSIDIDWIDS